MTENIATDPNWWPHRYDPARGHVHYIQASRADHRTAAFLTDEYLESAQNPRAVLLEQAANESAGAPINFIFHSAYCCSTLLARAFDLPGISMGLKEPQILNDLSGWRHRGAKPEELARVTANVLSVLSCPFEEGEGTIVKPSNLVNGIAGLILHLSPESKAIFLHAPLKDYIGSIARKGVWGRFWVRELLVKQLREGLVNIGIQGDDYLKLTDLQVAAVGWIVQHQLFAQIVEKFGSQRIRTLNSSKLMASPMKAMRELTAHFNVHVGEEGLQELVSGPVFQRHSKFNTEFDASAREANRSTGQEQHAEEIEKVLTWADVVSKNIGLPMDLPAALI